MIYPGYQIRGLLLKIPCKNFRVHMRQILWVFWFIPAKFVKFLGKTWNFPPRNLVRNMCKFLDFIPEHPRKLKRNSLSKSMKKAFSLKSIKNSINSDLEAKSDLEIFTGKFFFRFSFIRYPQLPSLARESWV